MANSEATVSNLKMYYNLLLIFTNLNNQEEIDEATFESVSKALREAFENLAPWEQDMLQHTINFEVSEIIL